MLDEPTNHLDMQSENILIQALQQYEGSFVVVSHNRHFVNKVANKIWYIEDQEIKEYPGTFDEFEFWWNKYRKNVNSGQQIKKKKTKTEGKTKPKTDDTVLKNINKKLTRIETELEQFEKDKVELEEKMADPKVYGNPDLLLEVNTRFEATTEAITEATSRWEIVAEELDSAEQN